jgi:5-(carboxyamino)imidazole ribonucleotide mutase
MKQKQSPPLVGIIMGSDSDWPTLQPAAEACAQFGVACEVRVVSAHRTPLDMVEYARTAHERGMVASLTPLPVIGVPVESKALKGLDSLLSIVQMPAGVPVATVAIGGGRNAGLLAVQILGAHDESLRVRVQAFKQQLAAESQAKNKRLQAGLKRG